MIDLYDIDCLGPHRCHTFLSFQEGLFQPSVPDFVDGCDADIFFAIGFAKPSYNLIVLSVQR
jgi:hypothetical protein